MLAGARHLGEGTRAHALAGDAPLPPAGAALVNGTLIHGLDFDDTHIGASYHATAERNGRCSSPGPITPPVVVPK